MYDPIAPRPEGGEQRRPYAAPALRRVPLVPEELFVASCVKTPRVCRPRGAKQKVKS